MASLTCPNCQSVVAADTTTCPSCGNPLGSAQATAFSASPPPAPAASYSASAPPPPATHTPGSHAAKPQIKFDFATISQTDRLVGGGSLVLFIALFLPWFSVKLGVLGSATASGLSAHGYLYVTLILTLAVLALLVAEALGLWKLPSTSQLSRDQILLIATVINLILVVIAFAFKPSGLGVVKVGWSWGAFVALVAAVVAAFPLGWPIIQARRGKS
jgi:hypothetical protein